MMTVVRQDRFPLRVENLLAEAGGSVYAWYESELADRLDPEGQVRRRSAVVEAAVYLAGVVLAAAVLAIFTGHPVLVLVLAGIYLVGNGVFGTGLSPAPWGWSTLLTGLSLGAAVAGTAASGVGVLCLVFIAGGLLSRLVMYRFRGVTAVVTHVAAAVAGGVAVALTGAGLVQAVVALVVGVVAGWVAAYVLQGRRALSVLPVRLRPEQFTRTLPDPPSQLPLLLRSQVREFEERGRRERKQGRRAREDAAIDVKKIGGAGERATALLLLGLRRGRWTRIVHDVEISGATQGGNVDHVVLARSGGWVLDSKRFGSRKDPGLVQQLEDGTVAHVAGRHINDLTQTLRTAAWATQGIQEQQQIPFRGLLVVHNAEVEPGLSVKIPAGHEAGAPVVTVDVVAARYLIGYLDSASAILSRREVSSALWGFQAKLVSATTGRAPRMVAPIGGGPAPTPPAPPEAQVRESPVAAPVVPVDEGAVAPVVDVPVSAPPAVVDVQVPDPRFEGEGLSEMVERRVRDRWAQVEEAEPAAPDDVPDELRQVERGTPISHIGFTADGTDVMSVDLVAVSAPCRGVDGPFVWACRPEQWKIHKDTGRPVMVETFPLESLVVRAQEDS